MTYTTTATTWQFTCGTKTVVLRRPYDWRVVCATCGAGGRVRYDSADKAHSACVRDSARACRTCGAS